MRAASKTRFFELARECRTSEIAAALSERPELASLRDHKGRTAKAIVVAGADPNHCLHGLVYADDLGAAKLVRRLPAKALRLLVRYGADVRAVANDGTTVGELATRAQRRLLAID